MQGFENVPVFTTNFDTSQLPGFPPVFWDPFDPVAVKTREDGTQTLTWLLSHGTTDEGPEYFSGDYHILALDTLGS